MFRKKNKNVTEEELERIDASLHAEHKNNVFLQKENEKLGSANCELMDEIAELKDKIDNLEAENLKLKDKIDLFTKSNVELRSKNQYLTDEYLGRAKEFSKELSELTESNAKQSDSVADLSASLAAVSQGIFSQNYIEIAILKTFQNWKYIYYNGNSVQDIDNIDSLCVSWDKGERVRMTVDR